MRRFLSTLMILAAAIAAAAQETDTDSVTITKNADGKFEISFPKSIVANVDSMKVSFRGEPFSVLPLKMGKLKKIIISDGEEIQYLGIENGNTVVLTDIPNDTFLFRDISFFEEIYDGENTESNLLILNKMLSFIRHTKEKAGKKYKELTKRRIEHNIQPKATTEVHKNLIALCIKELEK